MKPELSLERFLEVLAPGTIFCLGAWYAHRPILSKYFPTIASFAGSSEADAGISSKAAAFLLITLVSGFLFKSCSDVALVLVFRDRSMTDKSKRMHRRLAYKVAWLLGMSSDDDPRVNGVRRYLESHRAKLFLAMVAEWAHTDSEQLKSDGEKVVVHQHLVARLRTLSSESRSVLEGALQPVHIFSSLHIALCSLAGVVALGFVTNYFSSKSVPSHSISDLTILLLTVIVCAWLTAYVLRRSVRQFAASVLTYALHFYAGLRR